VAFRAGGFRAFVDGPVSRWSNRVVTWQEATARDDRELARDLLDDVDAEPAAWADRLLAWLGASDPRLDPVAADVAALVAVAESDPTFTRADQLAAHAGVGLRTLQRQFAEYVGIGPKWVVQRFRLLDAAAAAHRGDAVDWSTLATELGYSDQAHLTRAFTAVVGSPPVAYLRRT
jgi:AraC-like DNA-binding protein